MSYYAGDYDIAVIGAGHAGCEAGLAAARLGMKTLVFSISLEAVANMPCNPHIGGSSKGHLVREIDALGGEMGKNIDKTMIQIKMLNTSKGPAVHSLRAQADRKRYHMEMKHTLEKQENLYLKQGEIVDIKVENGKVREYVKDIAKGIKEKDEEITELISKNLKTGWTIDRISTVDLSLLKLAIYEIKYGEIPYKIAINEAVNLAKKYGEEQSSSFVNGILAKVVE